jgi:transcriptional regulator with XRE-family HTH domain
MELAEAIRKGRMAKQYSDEYVAKIAGFSIYEYGDLEGFDNEWRMVCPMYKVACVAKLLDVPLIEYLPQSDGHIADKFFYAGHTLKSRREQLGLTREAFSDLIGINDDGVVCFETSDCIFMWPFECLETVCKVLKIDIRKFVVRYLM